MKPATAVGVLAEDNSDCEVIKVIARRLRSPLKVHSFGARGAAQLERKGAAHMSLWAQRGCTNFIVLHDLDRDRMTNALHDEVALRRKLETMTCPPDSRRLICIPVEELEAWFWADPNVLKRVGGERAPRASLHPREVGDPKGELARISKRHGKTHYSTNDNKSLAELLDIGLCADRCEEFAELRQFILAL